MGFHGRLATLCTLEMTTRDAFAIWDKVRLTALKLIQKRKVKKSTRLKVNNLRRRKKSHNRKKSPKRKESPKLKSNLEKNNQSNLMMNKVKKVRRRKTTRKLLP